MKIWPSIEGFAFSVHKIIVSLVPRLTATSASPNRIPASEAGLSPVNATTEQSCENLYRSTMYWETLPMILDDGTGSPKRDARPGAQAYIVIREGLKHAKHFSMESFINTLITKNFGEKVNVISRNLLIQ